jgi:hypothetical protein
MAGAGWTGERANKLENPTVRGPIAARRYAAMTSKFEAARKRSR